MKTFYITTPIYYANSLPHLGHFYTTTIADIVAKHKRQRGFDVYFLTGTDEHGVNIQRVAGENGQTPQEYVDYISSEIKKMFGEFGLTDYDVFMRTTEPFHYEAVQNLWREIAKNVTPKGNPTIYKGFYEGWFCAPCGEYKTKGEYYFLETVGPRNKIVTILGDLSKNISLAIIDELIKGIDKYRNEQVDFKINFEQFRLALNDEKKLDKQINDLNFSLQKESSKSFLKLLKLLPDILIQKVETNIKEKFEVNVEKIIEIIEKEINPFCKIHQRPLDKVSEKSYFFRLSDYDEFLIETIESDANLVRPEGRKNEVLSFIKSGLQDLSISRETKNVSWGIPVPDDENHVMYVWLDALSNYITAIGYGNDERKLVGFEKYWQNVTHLVGKDILRFHTVYWFSFLKAANLALPKTVYAHGMWLDAEGRKMGKTLGNAIDLETLKTHFQTDAIRYFVLREMVFGQDGKFGYENLIERANADLASGLGNLSSRTLSMITKYRGGKIPSGKIREANYLNAKRANINADEQELVSVLDNARNEFLRKFDNFEFSGALEIVWNVIARIDKMISDAKPWELAKDENQAEILNAVLYRAAESLRWLCVLLFPVMPEAMRNIYAQIGLSGDLAKINPESLKYGELLAETAIGETSGVFPRIDRIKVMNEIIDSGKLKMDKEEKQTNQVDLSSNPVAQNPTDVLINNEPQPTNNEPPAANEEDNFITIDDFLKVELKVGEIKVAERIPKADKLLRFEIDLGEGKPRQILAGLAEYYNPETLVGRKVIVVANLKPRKMRGLESQGMICAASLEDGTGEKPALAAFIENVDIGARLK